MSMPIQFAFGNPKRTRRKSRKAKKGLAKKRKGSKLKFVRHKRKSLKGASVAKRKHIKRRRHKRNPTIVSTKARPGHKRGYKDITKFPDRKELRKAYAHLAAVDKKYRAVTDETSPLKKQWRIKLAKAKTEAKKLESEFNAGQKTLEAYKAGGYKLSAASASSKKKRKKKKSKGGSVAKKRKSKKRKSSRKAKRKISKKHLKKMLAAAKKARKAKKSKKKSHKRRKHSAKKHTAKKSHRRSKRRSHKRRSRRAKMYTHKHSRKTGHYKRGSSTVVSFKTRRRKGRPSITGRIKIRLNPLGGPMDKQVKDFTGHDLRDLGSLAAGGAIYGAVNSIINKYMPAQVSNMVNMIPLVGPSLLPILVGSLLHKYGAKVPGAQLVGEGLVAASVVGIGVQASQFVPGLAGVDYTPSMRGVDYTPGMGVMPQLRGGADFGRSADYGGSGGYTETHRSSRADFGGEGDPADDEYVGLGNDQGSVIG